MGELLPKIASKTKVVRKHQHWFHAPDSASNYAVGEFPIYLIQTEDGVFYGLPSIDGDSVKVAEHTRGTVVTTSPSDASIDPDPEDTARVKKFLSQHLPGVTGDPIRHAPCFYTMTEDEHFIVGEHPEQRGLFLAAGLSGHGFKFTSVLGSGLADLVIDEQTDVPIGFLSP